MKFCIQNRWTGATIFEAELEAHYESAPRDIQLGAAVRLAFKARANLADANLAGANLARANLAGAYLADANLAGAYLADANLADANLADANLARANLADANLADANLAGANLARAKWRDGITINKVPIQIYGLTWPVHILDRHMQIGCELHSHEDWSGFGNDRIKRMDPDDALSFWQAHKDWLLALCRQHAEQKAKAA